MNKELEIWWSSLSIKEKERIARKAQSKQTPDLPVDEDKVRYPACTQWWNQQDDQRKQAIHDHCVGAHGLALKEWDNARPYGGD